MQILGLGAHVSATAAENAPTFVSKMNECLFDRVRLGISILTVSQCHLTNSQTYWLMLVASVELIQEVSELTEIDDTSHPSA